MCRCTSPRNAPCSTTQRVGIVYVPPPTAQAFSSPNAAPACRTGAFATFVKLSRQIGLRGASDSRGPRLHDLRHRLAVSTLLHWHRRGVDVERRLPALS